MLLITQPRVGTAHNEIIALQAAAREDGWEVYSAPMGWRLPEHLTTSGVKGVPYGSQTFCEVIAQQMKWTLKQNSFDWLVKVPVKFLKRRVDFMSIKEATQLHERKFIKPADDKCFDAKVYEPGQFIPHECIPADYPVLVSDVVQFDVEYRIFMDGFKSRAWSNYLFYGEINDPRFHHMIDADQLEPVSFVNKLMISTDPDNLPTEPCVIDVGIIHGKGMAVIETNQAWASGIYGCDPYGVLKVLEASCE
jgi:hypothetical protein